MPRRPEWRNRTALRRVVASPLALRATPPGPGGAPPPRSAAARGTRASGARRPLRRPGARLFLNRDSTKLMWYVFQQKGDKRKLGLDILV